MGGGGKLQHGLACPAGAMRGNSIDWLGGGLNPKNKLFLRDMEFVEGKNFRYRKKSDPG